MRTKSCSALAMLFQDYEEEEKNEKTKNVGSYLVSIRCFCECCDLDWIELHGTRSKHCRPTGKKWFHLTTPSRHRDRPNKVLYGGRSYCWTHRRNLSSSSRQGCWREVG